MILRCNQDQEIESCLTHSYTSQSIDFQSKPMDWSLYSRHLRHLR